MCVSAWPPPLSKYFLMFMWNFCYFNLFQWPLIHLLDATEKSLVPSFFKPLSCWVFIHIEKMPLSLFFSWHYFFLFFFLPTGSSSQLLFNSLHLSMSERCSSPLNIFMTLWWTCSSMSVSVSFVLWSQQLDTALQMCLPSTKYSGIITDFDMLAIILINTSQDVASIWVHLLPCASPNHHIILKGTKHMHCVIKHLPGRMQWSNFITTVKTEVNICVWNWWGPEETLINPLQRWLTLSWP